MSDKYYDSQFTGLEIDEEIRYVKEVARNKIEEHSKALSEKADNKLVVKYSEKNQPNGYLGLDKNGKIDASLLPDDYKPDIDLDNYYTQEEIDNKIEEIDNKIEEIQISGDLVVDDAMSDTSENAVQNKVIKAYVDESIQSAILDSWEVPV